MITVQFVIYLVTAWQDSFSLMSGVPFIRKYLSFSLLWSLNTTIFHNKTLLCQSPVATLCTQHLFYAETTQKMNYQKNSALLYKNTDINIQYCTVNENRYYYEHTSLGIGQVLTQ